MMWVLFAFIAIALGIILFSKIQPDIPDEFGWLKSKPRSSDVRPADPPVSAQVGSIGSWAVSQQNGAIEYTKPFEGTVKVNNLDYAAPVLGVLCTGNELLARVDTQAPTTGRQTSDVRIDGMPTKWDKAAGTNLLVTNPRQFLRQLADEKELVIEFSYTEGGFASATIAAKDIKAIRDALPKSCKF